MKNPLSDIYEQILLSEAEKHALENPSSDEVGKLPKENIFDSKPKPVEGADKAKVKQGPQYQQTTGTSSAPKASGSSGGPKGAPAKSAEAPKSKEMKDTDVDPSEDDDEGEDKQHKFKKKDNTHKESFTMSAFETLFKKTLMNEEMEEEMAPVADGDGEISPDTDIDIDAEPDSDEDQEEELEEEEGDLISDLRDLQDRLDAILSKLEDIESEEEELEGQEYTEDEFDNEFEDQSEEAPMKESLKALSPSKGKSLQNKNNKVKGTLSSAKKGKAKPGTLKEQPKPTALGDKKKALQNKSNKVHSSVTKGDFFK